MGGVEGAHILCVQIVESHFPTWNIYHAELELSLRVIWVSKQRYVAWKMQQSGGQRGSFKRRRS